MALSIKLSGCLKLISRMPEHDQENFLNRAESYVNDGVDPTKAHVMAANDMLAEISANREDFYKQIAEQHPDLLTVKGEKPTTKKLPETEQLEPGNADKFTNPKTIKEIVARLAGDGYKTINEARAHLSQLTETEIKAGTKEAKRADEAIELAGVVRSRDIIARGEEAGKTKQEIYKELVSLYEDKMPNLNVRTSTSVADQAYSTPTPLAYVASKLARITKDSVVAEPTAGNGALLIDATPNRVFANELNPDRAAALRSQGINVTEEDGTTWNPGQKVDTVIANPPFGVTRDDNGVSKSFQINDKYKTNEIDHAIALNALKSMKDDGTAVLLLGSVKSEDQAERSDQYNAKAKRAFYFTLYNEYNVIDHFTVSGDMYAKQGATWPVDVVVINGRGKSEKSLPAAQVPRIISDYQELGKELDREQPTNNSESVGIAPQQGEGDTPGLAPLRTTVRGSEHGGDTPNEINDGVLHGSSGRTEGTDTLGNRGADETPVRIRDSAGLGVRDDTGERSPGLTRTETKQEAETTGQVHYVPTSQADNIGTLVPVNMGHAIKGALTDLEKRVGNIDNFVADQLGYKIGDLSKNFSAEQIDALALAIDNIGNGGGFIIGDQTGVGKGRVVAGLIKYALKNGKTPIFVTEKPNLYGDMMRDLKDIGIGDTRPFMTNANEEIPLTQDAADWYDEKERLKARGEKAPPRTKEFISANFMKTPAKTDSMMEKMVSDGNLGGHDAIFTTYSQMQTVKGNTTQRQNFLSHFANDAIVIFDESHNAGGAGEGGRTSKKDEEKEANNRANFSRNIAGKAAGVFYSSATYAKRPSVMSLYFRTSMAKAVKNIKDLGEAISAGGVPLQQVVATMLAKAGQYIRRERSFAGVEYNVKQVAVDKKIAEDASTIFRAINAFDELKSQAVETMHKELKKEAKRASTDNSTGGAGAESKNFTSVLHNNINQLLLTLKAKSAVEEAVESLKRGEKVVLTLANTMGSFIEEHVEDHGLKSGDAIALDYGDLLKRYLEKSRSVTIKDAFGDSEKRRLTDEELGSKAANHWNATRDLIDSMDFKNVPISPIDYVKNELAKAGYKTGEITGRQHTIDYSGPTPIYRQRPASEKSIAGRMGMISKFNNGEHDAIILNQSGATGLSLHSSSKFKDQRQRHMIIMQAEGNIDTHMQMLGRIHRTGQVNTPKYTQLAADIPAEKRPAAVLAKKMASLNANTTASAKSALTAEDSIDFMNEYGDQVATELMANNPELNAELGDPVKDTSEDDGAMRKVTGRIPMLPLEKQEAVYKQLEDNYRELIAEHDALGTNKLEAKTLDADAITKGEPTEVFKGTESDNPFEQSAYAENVDMKKQGRAYTSEQVKDMLKEQTGMNSDDITAIRQRGAAMSKEALNKFYGEFNDYKRSVLDDIEVRDRRDAQEVKLNGQAERVSDLLRDNHVGKPVVLNNSGTLLHGIIAKIERKEGTKNPAALGSWKVTVAVADAMRHITLPLTKLTYGRIEPVEGGTHMTPVSGSGENTLKMFDQAQSSSRENRTIITGNILAGYGKFKGGQIVHFTDHEGNMKQGIMMPAKFDLKAAMNSGLIDFTPEQSVQFLKGDSGRVIQNEGNNIRIVSRGDQFIISMPSSKSEGGKFFLDHTLREAVGGDFIKAGNVMRATVDENDLNTVLKRLQDMGETIGTESFRTEANAIKGEKDVLLSKGQATDNPHDVDSLRNALLDAHNPADRKALESMLDNGKANIITAGEHAPEEKAYFDPSNGTTNFIADHIDRNATPEELRGLVRHEIANHALELGKDSKEYNSILNKVEIMRRLGQKDVKDAYNHVPEDTAPEDVNKETMGYLVEHSPDLGVVKRFIGWFREQLRSMGWKSQLSVNDLRYMAQTALSKSFREQSQREFSGQGELSPVFSKSHERFYSQLRLAMRDAPEKIFANGKQAAMWLQSNSAKLGVKADELHFSGVLDYLNMQGKITKQDVLDHLDSGGVKVQTKMMGKNTAGYEEFSQMEFDKPYSELTSKEQEYIRTGVDGAGSSEGVNNGTKYATYTVPNGTDYKEMLLTLPEKARPISDRRAELARKSRTAERLTPDENAELNRLANAEDKTDAAFRSSHFDTPNILAHTRFDTFTRPDGGKTLRVFEVQSDWGQKGKKEGFIKKLDPNTLTAKELPKRPGPRQFEVSSPEGVIGNFAGSSSDEAIGYAVERADKIGTPSAPFVQDTKAWAALTLKHIISHAIDTNHDKVVIINGEQAGDLYDLSKQVSSITARPVDDGKLVIYANKGEDQVFQKIVTREELPDTVGKDLADKIVSDFPSYIDHSRTPPSQQSKTYSGLDLKIGGEGMSKFYDGIVKQVTNDTLKRLGGDKVHTVDSADVGMDKSNKGMKYQDQTNMEFDITPAMRAKVLGEGMPLFSKSRLVRDIDEPAEEPKQLSGVDKNLGKIKDGFNELKEAYLRNPEFTQSKKIIGEYTGALQEIDFNLSKFAKQINDTFPKDKQEAITNYLQAGGDEAILRDRADKSGDKYKQGYQDALNLSPKEKEMANFIRDQQETFWKQANEAGILESHVDNYVRGQWERENAAGEKIIALANSGMLNDKPREAMQKVFANYFEGEQLGFKPTDKSIGYQFVAAQRSIRQAIAARKALTDLMHSKEADGRPTVSVGGGGSMIGEGEAKPYFVKPNIQAKDTEDYKSINHPSLRKWKWVGADIEGKPILMQGNMYIHPDAYDRMNALLGESLVRKFEISKRVPIIGGTRPGDAMLKMGAFIKSTMLVGPFHQFHLGEHAVFHGVNPFNTPEIDFDKRPLLREGVNHGLMLYNHNAMHEFAEGLTSGGLLHMIEKKTGILADKGIPYLSKTPIIGDGLQRYGEYLFQDYIPRVKAMMYEHAVERAMEYYKADIAAGKFSRDQLLDNAAKQANAAFGELNYKYMGRDPTQQDLARIVLLAPDFLEARFKFAGQALRPKGKEQMMALIKAAAIMAGGAQLLNAMFGDEDRGPWYQHPFSTIIGGREYSPRSVVGDISHLITDFRGFWSARLNPLWGKPLLELSTGRDAHGQLETLDDGVKSILKSWVPIPAQGAFKNSQGLTTPERFLMAALSSIGMTNFVSKTAAEKKISDIGFGHMTVMAKTALQQKRYSAFSDLKNDYISGDLNSMDDVRIKAKESGLTLNKMQLSSIRMARDTSPQGKIKVMEARMKNFSAEDVMSVWEEADPDEKKALHSFMLRKVNNSHTMKYADKQAARSELSK